MIRGQFHLVAFHESAHAVVSALLCVPITRLVVLSSTEGNTSYGQIPKPEGDAETAEKTRARVGAQMFIAGPLAEWMCEGSNGSFSDALAEIRSPHPSWGDMRCFNQCINQSGATKTAVIEETRSLLTLYWSAVAEVATSVERRAEEAFVAVERGWRLPDEPLLDVPGADVQMLVSRAIDRVRESGLE